MKLELKHVLYYAIGPAVITGALSLAPKAYEVFFETLQSLEYARNDSSPIVGDGVAQQVVSIRVANTGKKPLTAVVAELRVPGSILASSSVQYTTGTGVDEKRSGDKVVVQLPKLLPSEEFSISALVKSEEMPHPAQVVVRSDEVLGHLTPALSAPRSDFRLTAISAFVSGSAVLLMALAGLLKFPLFFRTEKRSAIMYIALATQNNVFIGTVIKRGDDMTFLEFADLLLAFGRTAGETRRIAMSGLRCLLAIASMAEASRALVQRNLDLLQGEEAKPVELLKATFKATGTDYLAFREFVDQEFGLAQKPATSAT